MENHQLREQLKVALGAIGTERSGQKGPTDGCPFQIQKPEDLIGTMAGPRSIPEYPGGGRGPNERKDLVAVPTGGSPSHIDTIFESMSPTRHGDREFVTSHGNVAITSEEPYDPFFPSYSWSETSHPCGKKGNRGKTGEKNNTKKKNKAVAMEENETVKGKRQRTTSKEERVSCKDLRAGRRDSLKTREQAARLDRRKDAGITTIAENRIKKCDAAICRVRALEDGGKKEKTYHQHVLLPMTRDGARRWVDFSLVTERGEGRPLLQEM